MNPRLTKIVTRTGDKGETALADGSRVAKSDPRIEAIGAVDELNSAVGLIRAALTSSTYDPQLAQIQRQLFELGGELANPANELIGDDQVASLESMLDAWGQTLPSLADFILPGGTSAAAHTHMARAICRRAERRLVMLADSKDNHSGAVIYLNRLSDLLFQLARQLNASAGQDELLWHPMNNGQQDD